MRQHPAVEETVLVWNWPARITHWGFSVSLIAALVFGFQFDPESPWFRWHILAAYLAAWFLGIRILLGFVGNRYMRWTAFFHSPRSTLCYLAVVLRGERERGVGLNPGSSAFALCIYLCLAALIYSGFAPDLVETWHGRLAYAAVGLIGLHLLGLFLHALRHRALTPLAMVHGRVAGRFPEGLLSPYPLAGMALLGLSGMVLWFLVACYDDPNSVIKIPGLPEIPVPAIQKG